MAEMREAGTNVQQCYDYYDSWREALEVAGIPPDRRSPNRSVTLADLRENLQAVAEEIGHTPRTTDIQEYGELAISTYYDRYTTWQKALEDAGLTGSLDSTEAVDDATTHTDPTVESGLVNQIMNDLEDVSEDTEP
jgi:hypothetical protein